MKVIALLLALAPTAFAHNDHIGKTLYTFDLNSIEHKDLLNQFAIFEAALRNRFETLVKSGHAPSKVYTALKSGADAKLISQASADIKDFLHLYDDYNNAKIYFFGRRNYLILNEVAARIFKSELSGKESKNLQKMLTKALDAYKLYLDSIKFFGTDDDYRRVVAYRDFFIKTLEFSNQARKYLKTYKPQPGEKSAWTKFGDGAALLPLKLNVLFQMTFNARNGEGKTPIIEALRKLILKQAHREGYHGAEWEGKEYLPEIKYDGKTANMFIFMHAHWFYDTAAQAYLDYSGLIFFGAADVAYPKYAANRLNKSDDYIVVGRGNEMDKFEKLIRTKKTHGAWAAAEGLTPAGFNETRPLVPSFSKYVHALIERGLNVNIVPIAFPDHLKLMNNYEKPIEGNEGKITPLRGVIHENISTKMVLKLKEITGDSGALARLIRLIWMETLPTDEKVFMKTWPVTTLEPVIDRYLFEDLRR